MSCRGVKQKLVGRQDDVSLRGVYDAASAILKGRFELKMTSLIRRSVEELGEGYSQGE